MPEPRARSLRKNATGAERILWTALRNFKRGGLHFRRQAPIGGYIVDFVCHRAKLIVELDGSQHGTDEAMVYDAERTTFLNSCGYRAMRFWNVEIFKNLHGVCDAISAIAKEVPPPGALSRADLPASGEVKVKLRSPHKGEVN